MRFVRLCESKAIVRPSSDRVVRCGALPATACAQAAPTRVRNGARSSPRRSGERQPPCVATWQWRHAAARMRCAPHAGSRRRRALRRARRWQRRHSRAHPRCVPTPCKPLHVCTKIGLTPAHVRIGTGLAPPTSAQGPVSSDRGQICTATAFTAGCHLCHTCSRTRRTPAALAMGLGLMPASYICIGIGLTPCHICNETGLTPAINSPELATSAPRRCCPMLCCNSPIK
jgi:hypothetical protein